jgi:hypothetical protein
MAEMMMKRVNKIKKVMMTNRRPSKGLLKKHTDKLRWSISVLKRKQRH